MVWVNKIVLTSFGELFCFRGLRTLVYCVHSVVSIPVIAIGVTVLY
jgi:ABC-type tungstate transport system substrate-binding protein